MSHREILQRNHVYLKEHLDVDTILDELFQTEVFSLTDKERCIGKSGLAAQSDELLSILHRKGRKGYDTFLQILEKVQPYIKDHLEGRESSDSHTASAPDKQLADQLERLRMENDKLRMEAARREKSHIQLKSSHEPVKKEIEMLKNQQLQKSQGAAASDRARIPDSKLDPAYMPTGISNDGAYHKLRFPGQNITLQCPKLQLSADRANTDWCHVTTGGELVNSPPATQHRHSGRLRQYWGTCASTPIPLPPSPSTVTPVPHTPRYWETDSRVGVVGVMGRVYLLLEMGVIEKSQVDSEVYVCDQPRSWCVCVGSCPTHQGSLCTSVWQQGEEGECYSNTMSATPGTQATLHYGIVLDVGRGRLAFIDLDREVVLAKMDVEWSESLLPMFGVGLPGVHTVNMKVISGADITMTDTKKSLIYDALN
ncbi:uncharacterized protein LOC124285653 isoform X2 [Haliotis rubra]|uniref:uncharacterized protein LOC124285653 isoform X2 n=1 Tax=Haliotis rubra TaxID=36100 RepID=UPI001EE58451|nr:uncharacterized protein LOC124285653 isoform X2 [Haliotis rubra]